MLLMKRKKWESEVGCEIVEGLLVYSMSLPISR